jgi:hypothetical protein
MAGGMGRGGMTGMVGGMGGMSGMTDMGGMGGGMTGMGGMGRNAMLAQREFQNRVEIAQLSAALAASDKASKNQSLTTRLDQPLTMSFANPTPLEDVLKYIKSTPNGKAIPIYVDPKGLELVGQTMNSPVTIDLDGIPLKMSLRLVLKQLGLAYCVRDGVLIISSVQGIREELAEAASEQFGSDPNQLDQIMQSMGIQTGPGRGLQ